MPRTKPVKRINEDTDEDGTNSEKDNDITPYQAKQNAAKKKQSKQNKINKEKNH